MDKSGNETDTEDLADKESLATECTEDAISALKEYKRISDAVSIVKEALVMNNIPTAIGLNAMWNVIVFTFIEVCEGTHEEFCRCINNSAERAKNLWEKREEDGCGGEWFC